MKIEAHPCTTDGTSCVIAILIDAGDRKLRLSCTVNGMEWLDSSCAANHPSPSDEEAALKFNEYVAIALNNSSVPIKTDV